MPRHVFLAAVEEHGLNLPLLSEIFHETLAGVSRHIKNVIMPEQPFYFCRVTLEKYPERNCPDLLPALEETNGLCVYIADAVKTSVVSRQRLGGGPLPYYNVALKAEYRVMHPILRSYAETKNAASLAPIYLSNLRGASGYEQGYSNLFGDQNMAVLVYPIGKGALKGYFVVAVHHTEVSRFDTLRQFTSVNWQGGMDWIFSWACARYERIPDDDLEEELAEQKAISLTWGDDESTDPKLQRSHWPQTAPFPEAFDW